MSETSWRIEDLDQEPLAVTSSSPALVTLHFLLTALKRRRRLWVGLGCSGLLLGLAWTLIAPPKSVGTVSLMLAHETSADPGLAMSTDVSLLQTRTLAAAVVEKLNLHMTPEEFQQTITGAAVTTDVLVLEVTGPDNATAVKRTRATSAAYLSFRASQLRSQLEALNRGYEKRLGALRAEAADLRREYSELDANTSADYERASALVNRRVQVTNEIESIQRSINDATLKTNSIIDASYVLDPAASKPQPSRVRPLLLAMISGLIGGTAVGIGLVLTAALLSDRLRLRQEVALALGAPVRVGVGSLRPKRFHRLRRKHRDPSTALDLLVDALDQQVARPSRTRKSRPTRLALAIADNPEAGQLVMEHLVARLNAQGLSVVVFDLSTSGALKGLLTDGDDQHDGEVGSGPTVHRPDRVPSLWHGPAVFPAATARPGTATAAAGSPRPRADVELALVEVDPALGFEHLAAFVDEVVVLVTAGRSSAERLRTIGELIRAAGLRLPFALLVEAEQTDESLGLPPLETPWPTRTSSR
ncbi:MAG: hypothetical protein ACTHKG_10065 [Nocardioides sp.]